MTYIVIKHINGGDYLYRQSSYREGGKVRTKSEYLCPISTSVATQVKSTRSRLAELDIKATAKDVQELVGGVVEPPAPNKNTPTDAPLILWREQEGKITALWVDRKTGEVLKERRSIFDAKSHKKLSAELTPEPKFSNSDAGINTTNLRISVDPQKHRISETAINETHRKFCQHLNLIGLATSNLPSIKISYSLASKVEVHKRLAGGYRVNLPFIKPSKITKALNKPHDRRTKFGCIQPRTYKDPSLGVRSDFWREYRKALAYTFLDELAKQQPEKFKALKREMNLHYRAHNHSIIQYLKHTNSKAKIALTLHFKTTKELSEWTKRHIKSDSLGLPDHRARPDWKADCVSLLAETQKRGFLATEARYLGLLVYAQNTTKKANRELESLGKLDRVSGKQKNVSRAIKRGEAREQAILATLKKVQILKPYFVPESQNHDLPDNRRLEDFEIRTMATELARSRKAKDDENFRELRAEQTYNKMKRKQ